MSTTGRASEGDPGYTSEELSHIADLLERDQVWELVADAITASRDRAPRTADDRDSGDVLDDVITALRNAT